MKRWHALAAMASALALGAAAWLAVQRGTSTDAPQAGSSFVPGLADRADEVAVIEAMRGNSTVRLERQADGSWIVVTSDGYPAMTEWVRGLVQSLGTLVLDEPMTTRPERHGELGLAWPDPTGRSRRVRLLGAAPSAPPLCDAVLGDERAQPDAVFVRVFDQPETWRARGRLQWPGDALSWMNRSLLALPDDQARAVEMNGARLEAPQAGTGQGGPPPPWTLVREPSSTWTAAQRTLAAGSLGRFLERLEFDGVRRGSPNFAPDASQSPRFETAHGTITLGVASDATGTWFTVTVDEGATGEVAELGKTAAGWEYRMPDWKASTLQRLRGEAHSAP